MLTLPCREERAQLQCQLHIRGGSHHSRNNNEPFSRQWNAVIGGTCSKEGGFGCGAVILSLNHVQTGLIDLIKTSNPLACLRSPRPEAVILVTLQVYTYRHAPALGCYIPHHSDSSGAKHSQMYRANFYIQTWPPNKEEGQAACVYCVTGLSAERHKCMSCSSPSF